MSAVKLFEHKEHDARHQCLIYDGAPSQQLPALAAMIYRKLKEGYRCLYLNSRPMVAGIQSCLAALGVDVATETTKGSLILTSETALSEDGVFDIDLMLRKLENALDQALVAGYEGLWATGDMSWEFGPEKNFEKLMEYERRLEELFRKRRELGGICQYHRDTLPREAARQGLLTHRAIFINQTLTRINPHYAPTAQPIEHPLENPALDEAMAALCGLQNEKI